MIVDALKDAGLLDGRTSGGEKDQDIDFISASARRWLCSDESHPASFRWCLAHTCRSVGLAEDIVQIVRMRLRNLKRATVRMER